MIGGILDFYIFLGPDPSSVIGQYLDVVGEQAVFDKHEEWEVHQLIVESTPFRLRKACDAHLLGSGVSSVPMGLQDKQQNLECCKRNAELWDTSGTIALRSFSFNIWFGIIIYNLVCGHS